MRYENNSVLRDYLEQGAAGTHRDHMGHASFDLDDAAFGETLTEVREQHPQLSDEQAFARAAFRLLTSATPREVPVIVRSSRNGLACALRVAAPITWMVLKLAWAIALLLLAAKGAHAANNSDGLSANVNVAAGSAARNSATEIGDAGTVPDVSPASEANPDDAATILASADASGGRVLPPAFRNVRLLPEPQEPSGLILQLQNGGTVLATRPAGLVVIDCETSMSCSWSGDKFTLTGTGSGGSAATFQANGTNTSGQTLLNWQSGTNITVANPSAGNVSFSLSGQVAVANGGTGAATASANTVFGNCTGSSTAPAFCAFTTAMLPFTLPLSLANGGTAGTTFVTGQPVVKGASALQSAAVSIDASTQSGADMCAKIAAAWSTLSGISTSGGVVDARGFSGVQNCAGSMFTNYPDNSSFNGLLLLAPNVDIVTAVTQHVSAGATVEGNSGHPQYGPSPVPNTGAVIQAANSFATSTPVIEYGNSADVASVPLGQRLRNLAVSCLTPNGTYLSGSIGILNDYGEENAGGDGLFVDSCAVGIDVEGAAAINAGPWNNIIVHFDSVTDASAVCFRYGTTSSSGVTAPNRGIHGMSCDGESATTQLTSGFLIDDSNITLDDINIEAITTGIEMGGTHSVYGATIGNMHCIGTTSYKMTSCVDASAANSVSFLATNINAPSGNVTNVLADHGTGGSTIVQTAQQSVGLYSRDFKNNQVLTDATAFNGVCSNLDQTCLALSEEFFATTPNTTGTNTAAVVFEHPWIFLFNCTTGGGQTWGDSNGNAQFPNLGQARLTGCSTATGGDTMLAGMGYDTGGAAGFGALGSNVNWEARWGLALDGTTSETFRVGFCNPGSASTNTCQGATTSSIAVRYDTSQSDTGFLGETCDGSACSVTSGNLCTANTGFNTFRIRSLVCGTILFSCNNGTEFAVSTHVPSATMSPVVWHKTLAATQHVIKADFFKFRVWGLNR